MREARGGGDTRVEVVLFDLFGTLVDLAGLDAECEVVAPGRGAALG